MSVLSEEQWKVAKYQGIEYPDYLVSNLGRAKKVHNGKTKYLCKNTTRRRAIFLTNEVSTVQVPIARVILSSFYNTQFTRTIVADHINNNPCDDRICNLQAITQSENISKDHYCKKRKGM